MRALYRAGFALFVAAVVGAVGPGVANASVVYDYAGHDFTGVSGPYTTADSVTGSMTLSAALGDNLNLATVTPTAFSFSDGVQTISSPNTSSFMFSTDASGNITQYNVSLLTPLGPGTIAAINVLTLTTEDDVSFNGSTATTGVTSPGVWSTAAVTPLPAALPLFATGLGLTGLFGWRRKRKGPAIAA